MDKNINQKPTNSFFFHGSSRQNLTEITPRRGTVYAASDKIIAALFMMRRGPWTFSRTIGRYNGVEPFFVERYKSAFDDFYDGVSGSIYVLDASGFDKSEYGGEYWKSDKAQRVIQEIKIANVKDFLVQAEKDGALKIFRYPNRPLCIPQDDSDLIKRIKKAPAWLPQLKDLFPDLYRKHQAELDNII